MMGVFRLVSPQRNDTGIGFSLASLVIVAIVPLLVFGSGVAWLIVEQKRQDISAELSNTTRALGVAVDHDLLNQFAAMEVLATEASLDKADLAAFNAKARQVVQVHEGWRNVSLIEPSSHVILTSLNGLPLPRPVSLAPQAVDRVARTRKPLVAGVFPTGRLTPGPVILLMVPVMRADAVRYVMVAVLDAKRISRIFAEQALSPSWTGAIIDDHMIIAGRSRDTARYIGRPTTPLLAERIAAAEGGMFTSVNHDGETVYTVFSRSPNSGWSTVIGIPVNEVEAPIQRLLWQLAGAGGVLMLLALLLAGAVGSSIVKRRNAYETALDDSSKRLQKTLRKYSDLVAHVPVGVFRYRHRKAGGYQFEFVSPLWCQQLGLTAEAVLADSQTVFGRIHPEDRGDFVAKRELARDKMISIEWEGRFLVGEQIRWMQVQCSPMPLTNGDVVWQGIQTDVTERRQTERALEQAHGLLADLTAQVPGMVFQYRLFPDGHTSIPHASQGIAEMFELSADSVREDASPLYRRAHPDDRDGCIASLRESARTLSPWHHEYRVVLPKQGLRWRLGNARPEQLEDGSVLWHGFITDITERKRMEAELRELAITDMLTGLPNRRHFIDRLEEELARLSRVEGQCAAVLMLDLDHFKQVNDTYGHALGDAMLKHFAALLREGLRKIDTGGRVGGEEFAIILAGADLAAAQAYAERLRRNVFETPLMVDSQVVPITVSIGIAAVSAADQSPDASLIRADRALYRAKKAGRNRVELAE